MNYSGGLFYTLKDLLRRRSKELENNKNIKLDSFLRWNHWIVFPDGHRRKTCVSGWVESQCCSECFSADVGWMLQHHCAHCSDGGMDVVSDLRLGWDSKYAQKFRFQVSLVINFNSRVWGWGVLYLVLLGSGWIWQRRVNYSHWSV